MPKQWDTLDATVLVTHIYEQVLERQPDADGLLTWSNLLSTGQVSVKDGIRRISQSQEYRDRFINNQPPEQAVELCYKHFLGRKADESDLQHAVGIAQQQGVDAVIGELMDSEEYNRNFGEDKVPGKTERE
jgi:phycocyanin-associated rod linker protein